MIKSPKILVSITTIINLIFTTTFFKSSSFHRTRGNKLVFNRRKDFSVNMFHMVPTVQFSSQQI